VGEGLTNWDGKSRTFLGEETGGLSVRTYPQRKNKTAERERAKTGQIRRRRKELNNTLSIPDWKGFSWKTGKRDKTVLDTSEK